MADLETIRDELDKAALLYHRAISDQQLAVMALEWAQTFHDVSDDVFVLALRRHRHESRHWPTEADVLRVADDIESERRRRAHARALPDMTTPDEAFFEYNRQKARELLRRIAPEIDYE